MNQQRLLDALTAKDTLAAFAVAGASLVLLRILRPNSRTTPLTGPPRSSFLIGESEVLRKADCDGDNTAIQAAWVNEYGAIFKRAMPLGSDAVILTDPKAIAHFYANGETIYAATDFFRRAAIDLAGPGILVAHGDDHKRQRRALSAGFNNLKLQEYTSIFFESAHKVKVAWEQKLENDNVFHGDIAEWMNSISLDSMGLAGFSHDFGALRGERSDVGEGFANMANISMNLAEIAIFVLAPVFPILIKIPTERSHKRARMAAACRDLARQILANTAGATDTVDSKSILGLLIKSQSASNGFPMTEEEVTSQMQTLMLAGYETTSVAMTWGLIELARRPDMQAALRKELRDKFPTSDPTWGELLEELPLLDAVIHETLRLHPSVPETMREPIQDDIIPLSAPIKLPNGQLTNQILVAAGQKVAVPIAVVNRLQSLWGDDAREFKPERWLNNGEGIPAAAKELQGYHHLLTFIHGPRMCLGKNFAVAELKAVFSVLIKNFVFELPNGPDTVIRKHFAIVSRPMVEGQPRCHVPMRITRVE